VKSESGVLKHSPEAGQAVLLDLKGRAVWERNGREAGERFGAALAVVGAGLDRRTATTFLIGAPGWRSRTGRAYGVTADGESPWFIAGEGPGMEFGGHVAAGPDFDSDGSPSLVITETNRRIAGEGVGRSRLFGQNQPPD
jgi:hypothetical protein